MTGGTLELPRPDAMAPRTQPRHRDRARGRNIFYVADNEILASVQPQKEHQLRFAVHREASRRSRGAPGHDVRGRVPADVAGGGARALGEDTGEIPGEVTRRLMSGPATGTSRPRRA